MAEEPDGPGDRAGDALPVAPVALGAIEIQEVEEAAAGIHNQFPPYGDRSAREHDPTS
jgi:hypothetical protein